MENLFNILNTLAQFLMVFASFLAIIITMRQIRDENNENILLEFGMYTGADGSSGKLILIANVTIEITNLSRKPVYINQYGILFKDGKHNPEYNFCPENFVINSGETVKVENENMGELFSKNIKEFEDNKIYIYVTTGRGKKIIKDTDFTYSFVAEKIQNGLDFNKLFKNKKQS